MDERDAARGAAIFTAARALIGVRFRPQGHDPAHGLDCVGLVCAAHARAGCPGAAPTHYPLRGWSAARIETALLTAGLVQVGGPLRPGDVALIALPAGQFHLAIIGPDSWVHAHAGLRRVVETPGRPDLTGGSLWRWRGLVETERG